MEDFVWGILLIIVEPQLGSGVNIIEHKCKVAALTKIGEKAIITIKCLKKGNITVKMPSRYSKRLL